MLRKRVLDRALETLYQWPLSRFRPRCSKKPAALATRRCVREGQNFKVGFVRILPVRDPRSEGQLSQFGVDGLGFASGWDQSFPCPMRTAGSSAYHLFAIASILRTPPMSATRAATAASRPVGGRRLWAVLATANVSNALWFSPTHAKRRIGRNGSTGR